MIIIPNLLDKLKGEGDVFITRAIATVAVEYELRKLNSVCARRKDTGYAFSNIYRLLKFYRMRESC